MSGESTSESGAVFRPQQSQFLTIAQAPIVYWLGEELFLLLATERRLGFLADLRQGMATSENARFLRYWWEIGVDKSRWPTYAKGGGYQKWYGLEELRFDYGSEGRKFRCFEFEKFANTEWKGILGRKFDLVERYSHRSGVVYTQMARGSIGPRLWDGGFFDVKSIAIFPIEKGTSLDRFEIAGLLSTNYASFVLRALTQNLEFHAGYTSLLPVPEPTRWRSESGKLARFAATLKRKTIAETEPRDPGYLIDKPKAASLTNFTWHLTNLEVEAWLHAIEARINALVVTGAGLGEATVHLITDETGAPAGWHPLVTAYEAIPPLPADLKFETASPAWLKDHPRIDPTPDELGDLKRRLRSLYEAGPGASSEADEEADASDTDDDDSEGADVSGARIPIPPETFLEELSQKLEIHPISVYWMLRELREKDGIVCIPELRRFVSDHFSVMVLRMLGHRWPRQVEENEPVPDWAEPSGIIPVTEGAGAESLISRVRKRIAVDFGAERVSAIEREFEEIMGVPLESWLTRDFFRNHISQFRKCPIAWQLQSTPEAVGGASARGARTKRKTRADRSPIFSCLVYYHRLDHQLLGTIRTQYAHPMRLRMETELRELERIDAKTRTLEQEERRADLLVRIDELKEFESRLERVEVAGFDSEALSRIVGKEPLDKWTSRDGKREHPRDRDAFLAQERRYDPDINDGVRVNIAPLQKAGLLAADVLAAKDVEKAISDRAEWRADERRWCREGKLPQPGWWK